MNEFWVRFEALCRERNRRAFSVCQELGFSNNTATRWKQGTPPKPDKLAKVARYFNTTADYLMGVVDDVRTSDERVNEVLSAKPEPTGKGSLWIPVLGKVAAGVPITAIEEILDYEEVSAEVAASGELFGLKVQGESMSPRICDGDVVVVRKQPDVDNGDIAVVLVNGEDATVKKIKKTVDGITLIPLNPIMKPIFYSRKEIETLPITIIGKVIELRGKFS